MGLFDDAVDHRQAKPCPLPFLFGREEGLEDMRQRVPIHALSGILHPRKHVSPGRESRIEARGVRIAGDDSRRHGQAPALGHGVFGVDGQIQHHLVDLAAIGANGAGNGDQVLRQRNVLADQSFNHGGHRHQGFVQIEHLQGEHLAAAEGEQLFGQGRCPLAGAEDFRERVVQRIFVAHLIEEQRGAAVDDREQVVEVVCNAAG